MSAINSIEKIISEIPNTESPLDCWVWTGFLNRGGYARISFNGKPTLLHRIMYEDFIGKIPSNLCCDHLCKVRNCINPLHIDLVTQKENVSRSSWASAVNARKTHCKRGHKFTKSNTYINKTSKARVCITCFNSSQKSKYKILHTNKKRGEQNA